MNTSTPQTGLPILLGRQGLSGATVVPYVVVFDTTGQDLTIMTPAEGKMACIVGWTFLESSATNITVKSGSTTLVPLKCAANQGICQPIGNPIICTQPGEALVMQVSTAVSMIVYVLEAGTLDLR